MRKIKIILSLMMMFLLSGNIVLAETISSNVVDNKTSNSNKNYQNESITIGNDSLILGTPSKSSNTSISNIPQITHYVVNGEVDNTKTGIDFYNNISISLIGDNLTNRHFLTKEGLHWSDRTYVELIQGQELGILNDATTFGVQNTPSIEVKAYRNNKGDSGRINFVGKTKSNEDLDLIWTVIDSDKEEWANNSGYSNNNRIKGLGFAGEQFIPGATGNSIAVLYNNASNLGINYKIVKHGTMEEMPVVLSFISTDIDAAQGVQTDLANITEIIPKESNLVKKDNIIYDATPGVVGLNGSVDLPKGGYLGAGFLSSFDYIFYSPAPERVNDSYYYPIAVRYDIFGSSLQANLFTRLQNHITVSYVDESGITIKPNEEFTGFHDEKYLFQSVAIPKYKLVDIKKDESNLNYPKLQFVYRPVYTVTLKFTDESGKTLAKDKVFLAEKGYSLLYNAENIAEFTLPNQLKTVVNKDIEHTFVYKKIVKPIEKKEDLVDNKVSKENITKEHTNTTNNKVIGNIELPVNYNNYIVPTKPIQVPKTTNFNNINNNSTIIQNTYIPAELNQKTAYVEQNNEKVDPFLINTGMTKDQKEIFLNYIKEVAKKSREKHGNNQDKINHDIANAIAYSVYYDDFLQTKTNDFGERPDNLNEDLDELFDSLHSNIRFIIDFPHLAAPLATSEKSVWWKESIKFVGGLSPLNLLGVSPKDVLFLNNSMTGDLLTNIDEKDARTNKDAYILKYHPDFKDLSLEERIEKYYSIENLEAKRENYYNEALELKGIDYLPIDNYILINYGAVVSIAGLGLISLTALRKFKKVLQGVIAGSKEIVKHTKDFVSNKITSFTSKVTAGVITAKRVGTSLLDGVKKGVKDTYKNIIKPVVKTINKKIIQPITKYIVKPTLKIVNKVIMKPVQKIANVIYNKVVKPIHNKIIKPVYNKIIKPVAKVVSNFVVKSINTLVRPIVKTVTTKVAKPVGNIVAKNIVAPAGRLIKKLFGRN